MKYKNNKLWLILAIVALVLLSGCAGTNTGPSQTGDKQAAPGTTAGKPVPGSAPAIHFSKLIEYLPAPPSGWTADEPQGFMNTVESGSWSMANRAYSKGDDARANIGIMDSAYYEVGLFASWKGIYQYESTEGYAKTTTIKGYPALEVYSKSSKEYAMYVDVKDRFMVYITVDNADKDTLNNLANAIDYSGIAGLK